MIDLAVEWANPEIRDRFKEELKRLETEIKEAKEEGWFDDAELLEAQLEKLQQSLLAEYGPKLDKKGYDNAEWSAMLRTAAKDVSTGIGRCLRVLRKQSEDLFQHFDTALKPRGSYNIYKPQIPIDWVLE